MPSLTRNTLRKELMERLYATEDILYGTLDGTDTDTATANEWVSTMLTSTNLVGAWLFIDDTTDDLAPEAESRRIISYNPAAGSVDVDPVFTAALGAGDLYEIHYAVHPDRLNEALQWAITVGTNWAYAGFTDDITSVVIPDKDIMKEGALFRIKQGLVRRATGELKGELTSQLEEHRDSYYRGLEILGYRNPAQFGSQPTFQDRLGRI